MPGWSARRAAIGRLCVTTVSVASSGRSPASRATVLAGVEDHRALVRQLGDGGLCDAVLLVGRGGLALGEVGLEVQPPGRYGTAVHPPQESRAVEGLQIAADGLRGDLELLGQREHVHPTAVTGEPENLLLPLRCVHVRSPPISVRPMPELVVSLGGYARISGK